jgi:hypothetical protein
LDEPPRTLAEAEWMRRDVMEADMLILVIVLLVAWIIVSIVGFAMEGLVWLGIVGIVLFLGTAVIGAVRRRAIRR